MKKILIFMAIAVTAAFISCNKSTQTATDTKPVNVADLPLKAAQYIDTNYPDASILYVVAVTNNAASYIVTLNTTEELAFSGEGTFMGDGANFHGHHGDDSIHCDTIHRDSIHGEGGGHHGGHHGRGIPIDSLSSVIKSYIAANFPDYTTRHAEYDSVCPDGLVTEVFIGKPGQEPLKLYFNAAGTFLMQDSRVLYASVPQAVRDYIAANYASYMVCQRSSQLIMADASIQYIIHLRLNRTPLTVRLMADGTLVCTR